MFNGVPEQFHQFIASRTTTPLPLSLPLTLPPHVSPPNPPTFSNFIDPQQQQLSHQQQHQHQLYQQQSHLLHQLHQQQQQQSASTVQQVVHHQQQRQDEEKEDEAQQLHERVRSVSEMGDPWEKEEVVALLRIRSSMGHGFSDFIWAHVSRKLAELGYKRSPEKCKKKYEEMNQYCNDTTTTDYSSRKNYNRSFSELEALFEDHHQNRKASATTNTSAVDNEDEKNNMVRSSNVDDGDDDDDSQGKMGLNLEENSGNETLENPFVENVVKKQSRSKKRKRHDHKHELLKGLCEEIVNKIMNQQEELHKKLLQDIERKEEDRVRREEIWKKKEMDRVNKEIEMRAKEQDIACDRETTIIEFLKKFTSSISSSSQNNQEDLSVKIEDIIKKSSQNPTASSSPPPSIIQSSSENPKSALSSVLVVPTNGNTPKVPTSSSHVATATNRTPSPTRSNKKIPNLSHLDLVYQNPNSIITTQNNNQGDVTSSSTDTTALTVSHEPGSTSNNDKEENGKRWPRDEVYALINLRCNLGNSSSSGGEDKENTKIPLWEKISQGMSELGFYKRSAKKCKEKWENINKYFRKTKDTNKKRSLDSKTCPYFHQLNTLYNQGRLALPSDGQKNQSTGNSTENHP